MVDTSGDKNGTKEELNRIGWACLLMSIIGIKKGPTYYSGLAISNKLCSRLWLDVVYKSYVFLREDRTKCQE